jgi:hypothetical protein
VPDAVAAAVVAAAVAVFVFVSVIGRIKWNISLLVF